MKKVIIVLGIVLCLMVLGYTMLLEDRCVIDPTHTTSLKLDSASYNLGRIAVNDTIKRKIGFTNTGTESLLIFEVKTSCGCTVVSWPDQPILPGDSDELVLIYSEQYPQRFHKSINIFANIEQSPFNLSFTGLVIKN